MYTTFCVSRETADRFIKLFVNRRAYGMQAAHPLPNGSVPYYLARDWQTKKPKPLDADVVRMHLNGDITINLYAINPETQRSKWVAIDADFDGAVEALFQLQWELKQDGVEAALEQSRRGGHLWIFAETPLLASECRIYIYNLALRLGVPVKGGGLKDGIEVFPRQDRIEDGEYGNAIRAPLGVHRKTNQRYWFYEAALTPEAQLDYLDSLKKLTEAELRTFIQGMTLPEAYRPVVSPPYIPPASSTLAPSSEFSTTCARRARTAATGGRVAHRAPRPGTTAPATTSPSRSRIPASTSAGPAARRKRFARRWASRSAARLRFEEAMPMTSPAKIVAKQRQPLCAIRSVASAADASRLGEARHLLPAERLDRAPASGAAVCAARRRVRRRGRRHGPLLRLSRCRWKPGAVAATDRFDLRQRPPRHRDCAGTGADRDAAHRPYL
jgi:hypothetical protein